MSEHDHGHDHDHNHSHDHDEPSPSHESGLVSMGQARDIAIFHARENPELYDRRYRRQTLALGSSSSGKNGRPPTTSGCPSDPPKDSGASRAWEEFTISRSGSIHSRFIISQPVRQGGFPGCGLVAALALSAMMFTGLGAMSLVL